MRNISVSGRKEWQFHAKDWLDYQISYAKRYSNLDFDYEDIDYIFQLTDIGTEVIILDQPIKIARIENDIFLQVHPSYSNQYDYDLEKIRTQIELLINNEPGLVKINWGSVESLLKEQNGLATKVTVRK